MSKKKKNNAIITTMRLLFCFAFVAALMLGTTTALTTVVFLETFDSGLSGWTTAGNVALITTPVLSGSAVQMIRGSISRSISTIGFYNLTLSWNVAASSLESLAGDACMVEVSWNSGSTWFSLFALRNGYDNKVYRFGSIVLPSVAENSFFFFRYRAATSTGDYCYGETIRVVSQSNVAPSGPTGSSSFDPLSGSGVVSRSVLTYRQLVGLDSPPTSPVSNTNFQIPATAAAPIHNFEGRLTVLDTFSTGSQTTIQDTYNYASDLSRKYLPAFDVEMVQHGTHLIPVVRRKIYSYHPVWEYFFGTGRVWTETTDQGKTRASLPFAIAQTNANCVHNGLLTFLYDSQGIFGGIIYQIVEETCAYYKFNGWGRVNAVASYYSVPGGAAVVRNAWALELSLRLPVKDLSALVTDFPSSGVDISKFGNPSEVTEASAFGLVVNGIHYRSQCSTRFGSYPFCSEFVFPSYSTAKADFLQAALMLWAQKFGVTGTFYSTKIFPAISSCPQSKWGDVSIEQAMDMVTGNYAVSSYMTDEDSTSMSNGLFLPTTHASKLSFSCNGFSRKSNPGSTWVYHTSENYLVSTLLQSLVVSNGVAPSLVDFVNAELYGPLNLSQLPRFPQRTYDSAAQVWGAWGNYYTSDDVAKISDFFNAQEGKINGVQVLDYQFLKKIMQRDPANRGYRPTPNTQWDYRFKSGFWAIDLFNQTQNCATYVPYNSGYGGIQFVMLPNKIVYYQISDADTYAFASSGRETLKLVSPCQVSYSP